MGERCSSAPDTGPMTWPPKKPSRAPPITMRSEDFCSANSINDSAKDSPTSTVDPALTPLAASASTALDDPFLAALDEQTLVLGAAGMAVRQFLAHDEDDVDVGVEGLGERAGKGDPVVAGGGGQIPDGQMHCCRLALQ